MGSRASQCFPEGAPPLRIQIPLATIAHFRLAPCLASSMLFASLRPGRRPGLRALTTPARGTTWLLRDGRLSDDSGGPRKAS